MTTETLSTPVEDLDSRTAIVERKRTHDEATQNGDPGAVSADSTPRKRKKHASNSAFQDVRDFVPNGGSFGTNGTLIEDADIDDTVQTSTAPPMSWNAVNNTKIRTSLGGGLVQNILPREGVLHAHVVGSSIEVDAGLDTEPQKDQTIDVHPNPKITEDDNDQIDQGSKAGHEEATKVALSRLEGFRQRLASMDPHDGLVSAYKAAQVELEKAEVDYNYCLYYPVGTPFSPPPRIIGDSDTTNQYIANHKAYEIWQQIKEYMKEGTLEDFKEGRIYWGSGSKIQDNDIQTASRKLRRYLKRYSTRNGGHLSEAKQKTQRDKTSDLNYCKFFPLNEEYLPLHRAKQGLENLTDFRGGRGDLDRRAAQIWKLVQQCESDGTLEGLRDGKLEQCIIKAPSALQAAETVDLSESGNENKVNGAMTVNNGIKSEADVQESHHPNMPLDVKQATDLKENDDFRVRQMSVVTLSPNPEETLRMDHNGSESDEGLVLNTYNHDQILPVETDHNRRRDGNDQALEDFRTNRMEKASDDGDSSSDGDSDSENSDVMDQTDSEQVDEYSAPTHKQGHTSDLEAARTLAHLSPQDIDAQLRYFHATKKREEVDGSSAVRCLICSARGHMAEFCEKLRCSVCGTHNHHITQDCPSTAKCSKCREMGHDRKDCPYKLKNLTTNEIICDLCQRNGHIEADCELQWRTSGRPWESDVSIRDVRLSCYECGRSGHLGNDCPTRRPGKSMGSSTWGSGSNQISIKSRGEISIKGTARHDPIDIDDGHEDSTAAFLRPKVPEPVRRGKIRIKTAPNPRDFDMVPYNGWNPVDTSHELSNTATRTPNKLSPSTLKMRIRDLSQSLDHNKDLPARIRGDQQRMLARYRQDLEDAYDNDTPNNSSYRPYSDDDRGDWRAANNRAEREDYGRNDRRPPSPEYRNYGGYTRPDTHLLPRPPPGADAYRPMPSSAQHAWSRHRV